MTPKDMALASADIHAAQEELSECHGYVRDGDPDIALDCLNLVEERLERVRDVLKKYESDY